MKKAVVAVIFGSRSAAHDVSVATAIASVIRPLRLSKKYDVLPVYIAKDGRWFADKALGDVSLYSSGKIDEWVKKHEPVLLSVGKGLCLTRKGLRLRESRLDVVFPALCGTDDDGALTGMLEMAGVAYTGCGMAASAVATDKVVTRQLAQANDVAVLPYIYFAKHEFEADPAEYITQINRRLHYPLLVRPARSARRTPGAGVARAEEPGGLSDTIATALHYGDRVLVEEDVRNLTAVTLPILGNETLRVAALARLPVDGEEDPDVIPADLPKDVYEKAESVGLAMYRALGCSGMASIDMLVDADSGMVFCDGVNPWPANLAQSSWNQAGVSNVALVEELVGLAMDRHARQAELNKESS